MRHSPARAVPRRLLAAGVVATLALAPAASAHEPFRNVLPAGQGETVDAGELAADQASGEAPASFTSQNGMYTGLVGAAPRLRAAGLDRYFKPETFGVPPQRSARDRACGSPATRSTSRT